MSTQVYNASPYFSKNDSYAIKGIAIIMMMIHHFWGFPEWIEIEVKSLPSSSVSFVFMSLKFCVAIFCFITGYAFFFSKEKTYKKTFNRILKLLIIYSVVFMFLAIIGVVFIHHDYTLASLNPYSADERTVVFDWYIRIYIVFMLIAPLYSKLRIKRFSLEAFFTCLIFPIVFLVLTRLSYLYNSILASDLANIAVWTPSFFIGYLFGKYGLFERIEKLIFKHISDRRLRYTLALFLFLTTLIMNYILSSIVSGITSIPFKMVVNFVLGSLCIFCVVYICKALSSCVFRRTLEEIGKVSAYMWFLHGAFFTYEGTLLQPILYYPGNPFFVTLWGILICFVPAYLLHFSTSILLKKVFR